MASKYDLLKQYLRGLGSAPVTVSFADVEDVIGARLPKAARISDAWWTDRSSASSHSHAFAWLDLGRRVEGLDRTAAAVTFSAPSKGD